VAKIPNTERIIENKDFPVALFSLILSFVFLKIQVIVKAVEKINNIANKVYHPLNIDF
jgi:hypothetical protein